MMFVSSCHKLSALLKACLILVSLHLYQNIEAEIDQDFNTKCWCEYTKRVGVGIYRCGERRVEK